MPLLHRLFLACLVAIAPLVAAAQQADAPVQQVLQAHADIIVKSSRKSIGPAIDALATSGLDQAQVVLQ
ncbi:MAG: urea ABC transporter permease subunit UrtB, partial [Pseudomonadota bacterium]